MGFAGFAPRRRSQHVAGVTLAELLVTITVIAVLSGAAVTVLSGGQSQEAGQELARRLAADITYAQQRALAHHTPHRVILEPGSERYGIYADGTLVTEPLSKRPFEVDLGQVLPGTQADLVTVSFGGDSTLTFDANGIPAAGGKVELDVGGVHWAITVANGSGHIVVRELTMGASEPEEKQFEESK